MRGVECEDDEGGIHPNKGKMGEDEVGIGDEGRRAREQSHSCGRAHYCIWFSFYIFTTQISLSYYRHYMLFIYTHSWLFNTKYLWSVLSRSPASGLARLGGSRQHGYACGPRDCQGLPYWSHPISSLYLFWVLRASTTEGIKSNPSKSGSAFLRYHNITHNRMKC